MRECDGPNMEPNELEQKKKPIQPWLKLAWPTIKDRFGCCCAGLPIPTFSEMIVAVFGNKVIL
jgi:hypothetical protein